MSSPIEGMRAVTVHVRDIVKARAFYSDVLGLKEVSFSEPGGRAVFQIPGMSAILTLHVPLPDEGGREPGTVSGIVFLHHDPVAAAAEIKRRGGTITVEPKVVQRPGLTFTQCVFADPDGNEFILRGPET
jgi:catechol 2,3-dioxygenase-like lactoylglutathione lyase family enzyme